MQFCCNLNLKQAQQLKLFQNLPGFVIKTCPEKRLKNPQTAEFQSQTLSKYIVTRYLVYMLKHFRTVHPAAHLKITHPSAEFCLTHITNYQVKLLELLEIEGQRLACVYIFKCPNLICPGSRHPCLIIPGRSFQSNSLKS